MLENFFFWLGVFLIIPACTVLLLSWLGNLAQSFLVCDFGDRSQYWLGIPGVMIHEISHAIAAIIFRHQISGLSLFNLHSLFHPDKELGHVNSRYNSLSFYQVLGNTFFGIMPVYGCSIAIGLLHKFLLHEPFFMFHQIPEHMSDAKYFWSYIDFWSAQVPVLNRWIFGIIVFMIVVTGFGLSDVDLKDALDGLKNYIWVVAISDIVMSAVLYYFHSSIVSYLNTAACYQFLWCLQSVAYLLTTGVLLTLVYLIHHKYQVQFRKRKSSND